MNGLRRALASLAGEALDRQGRHLRRLIDLPTDSLAWAVANVRFEWEGLKLQIFSAILERIGWPTPSNDGDEIHE